MKEQLDSVRANVTEIDWATFTSIVSRDNSRKLFNKYDGPKAFHNAFMANDQVAVRAIRILDMHTTPFIKAVRECMGHQTEIESLLNAVKTYATIYDCYIKVADLIKPALTLVSNVADIDRIRWAFLRIMPALSRPIICTVLCNTHLLGVNKLLTTSCRALEVGHKTNLKRAEAAEQQVEQLSARLEQHEQSVVQAVRTALQRQSAEIDSLKSKLKDKDRKIDELDRARSHNPIDLGRLHAIVDSIQEAAQIGLLAINDEEEDTTPIGIYDDLAGISTGLKLLVVGGARQQIGHYAKLDELCANLKMTYMWELAEYDDTGRAKQWITNNVHKYDIAIFLHWNRTDVHKHGLQMARKHKIIHGSCYYAGFLSLKKLLIDLIMNYSNKLQSKGIVKSKM